MSGQTLLFELLTEELPPLTLQNLSNALTEQIAAGIDAAGITHGPVRGFASPRRLAVSIESCADKAADRRVERRGPPVANSFDAAGKPLPAALAFARSCGVEVGDLTRLTTDKGAWLAHRGTEPGAALATLIAPIVAQAIAGLPIAKRMRWGSRTAEFVRPVHSVVLMHGPAVLACDILGFAAGRLTRGHRFHAPEPITLATAGDYESALFEAKVVADFARRRELVRTQVAELAAAAGGRALIEPALLDEVTALVEWPVPIAAQFEPRFLALPREVVIATVQDHQRYFPIENPDGSLSNRFITVSNIESRDPAKVREGNERVVRPRLSDAAFFWDQDRKLSLEQHALKLRGVTFQTRLGSYADKSLRVGALAEVIARQVAGADEVGRAAQLAKADLMTAMVGEFPELQGTMGRYYALAEGESAQLALALAEQYLPRYAGDALPETPTGRVLALADKLDTLAGIFSIDQKPTGTKDPFGLRRAALGVLRILLEGGIDLDLPQTLATAAAAQPVVAAAAAGEVHAFMLERLRGLLLDRADGTTAEMIDAVFAVHPRSPLDVVARLQALREFLSLPDAASLAAANKRIANLLKKSPLDDAAPVDGGRFTEAAEEALFAALTELAPQVAAALRERRYGAALQLGCALRGPIDAFFDQVMVMDEDPGRRHNRLALLRQVRQLFGGVADLSRLPG
jgi:glycyl-tRNA synthetase beta chain